MLAGFRFEIERDRHVHSGHNHVVRLSGELMAFRALDWIRRLRVDGVGHLLTDASSSPTCPRASRGQPSTRSRERSDSHDSLTNCNALMIAVVSDLEFAGCTRDTLVIQTHLLLSPPSLQAHRNGV